MISNNAYYELFASYTVPDHNRVGYWVDLGANSKGKVIKTYNENLKKWVKVTDATSEDAVAPFIGNNGNWWIDNRDTGINASGHSPYIGDNSNWFVYSSERNEHIDTGLPSRGEAGPKGDKGDKGKDATINGVGSIKIEAGDNITITQSDDTLTIIGDVRKPDLSNYATKTEVTKLDNKLQDAVSSVFRAKGSVKTYNNLPVDKVSIGDVYNVLDTGANYVAISINPITWDKLSETVDLSKFFNKEEINSLLSTKVDKQEGKQLTTEDFTTVLKRKLEGLSNYNDTEIRNAIDSLESAFNTLVEGNATVAIDTFNEIVAFLKNVENSQDLDSIIAGINTTISKVEAKIPDTNNFLSKDGGTMNNTNLVGNLNAELLNGYSSDNFINIHNLINGTATDALTVGLNTINQDHLWTNTPYSDIATLVDMSYSPDWRSLFFISPSTKRIHTRFKYNGDSWSNWKEIAFTDDTVAAANRLSTTRYLWGQPFDGSGDVYGDFKSIDGYNFVSTTSNHVLFGHGYAQNNKTVYLDGSPIYFRYGTNHNVGMILNSYGNVTIGEGDFASSNWKLYVNGNVFHNGAVATNSPIRLYGKTNVSSDVYLDNTTYAGLNIRTSSSSHMLIGSKVGIGVDYPTHRLHINGSIKAEYNPDYDLAHTIIGESHFYNDSYSDPATNIKAAIKVNGIIAQSSGNVLLCTTSGNVGINTTTPEYTLDVNGNVGVRGPMAVKGSIFMSLNTALYMSDEHAGIYLSDYGIYWHNSDNTWHSSIMTCDGSTTTIYKPLYIESDVHLTGSDQINGTRAGIALNYECGKAVNTTIWDGKGNHIMRVFGESRQVAIGSAAIESPLGTLNVEGDVVFEKSRFITTSGFVDGAHAYSHAIYGGYHGINVCEFYEDEFRFKGNSGITTLLNLSINDAIFNGAIQTHSCQYAGIYNGKARFWLGRDGATNTWLQVATDTTNEGGKLFMSGYNGTTLSEFNVYASKSTFSGNIIANGDVTAYSDIRLKNKIESVNNVLDTIDTLDVFKYTWKGREDKSVHIGISAQQVQNIYPEFVLTSSSEDGIDYLTVNYAALATCIAIQGIKELVKKGDERDKRIAALEEEVISLKEQLRYGNK